MRNPEDVYDFIAGYRARLDMGFSASVRPHIDGCRCGLVGRIAVGRSLELGRTLLLVLRLCWARSVLVSYSNARGRLRS